MTRMMLDTDILSEVLKRKDPEVFQRASAYLQTHGRLTFSCVAVFEVASGLLRKAMAKQHAAFVGAMSSHEVLPLDAASALLAGELDAKLRACGSPIGVPDTLVAAIALSHERVLVTGNTRHYARIRDLGYPLQLDNWRAAAPEAP